jgi:hypothetical protein
LFDHHRDSQYPPRYFVSDINIGFLPSLVLDDRKPLRTVTLASLLRSSRMEEDRFGHQNCYTGNWLRTRHRLTNYEHASLHSAASLACILYPVLASPRKLSGMREQRDLQHNQSILSFGDLARSCKYKSQKRPSEPLTPCPLPIFLNYSVGRRRR